ncbi:Fatty acid synthase subunit alpha 7 [Phlyctema vagabunda]|uniref:Fatty acid synthase subunit alpha 7 n=1 Tax=Phlyctema vagabunda TaxID=108571 RepID=A0ABR4PC10_9HELO
MEPSKLRTVVLFQGYTTKVTTRKSLANRAFVQSMFSNTIVKTQITPAYQTSDEAKILLDPLARISGDAQTPGALRFDNTKLHGDHDNRCKPILARGPTSTKTQSDLAAAIGSSKSWMEKALGENGSEATATSVGIDLEELDAFTHDRNEEFIARNYIAGEIRDARASLNTHNTFASRWCAKETVFKSLGTLSRGAGAPLTDIEIYSELGIPKVKLHGEAARIAGSSGIHNIQLSLSYGIDSVIAVALAVREK